MAKAEITKQAVGDGLPYCRGPKPFRRDRRVALSIAVFISDGDAITRTRNHIVDGTP